MELLCTTTNYNFNQHFSILWIQPFTFTADMHPFHVLCDNTQYVTFSLLFSAHTHILDAKHF